MFDIDSDAIFAADDIAIFSLSADFARYLLKATIIYMKNTEIGIRLQLVNLPGLKENGNQQYGNGCQTDQ